MGKSDIGTWLNGSEYYANDNVFTATEKSAIVLTSLSGMSYYTLDSHEWVDYAEDDYVFLLMTASFVKTARSTTV